ncbi:hypothetical protein REPUB_Repub10bG0030500 [Reevesia pubescens]
MNCVFWIFYGLPVVKKDNILVLTINSIGLAIELIYLFIYLYYANERKKRARVLYILGFEAVLAAVVVLITLLVIKFKYRWLVIGIICDVFNIVMYASPLGIVKKVIKTKSVQYMPFWLSVASLANGVCWTIFALIKIDIFILISNGLGSIFGVMQLILYGYYYFHGKKKTPTKDVKELEVQLSNQTTAPA